MSEQFNRLTASEHERLALLAEELGEVMQAIGKILRHGYESVHPDGGPNNRVLLETELGDVNFAVGLMVKKKDLDGGSMRETRDAKAVRIDEYLHHQGSGAKEAG